MSQQILTQMQIIQSLGESITWLQKELNWGVKPEQMNHLTGRIGELYTALVTNGQMAIETNQKGYDVIDSENKRVSVKTVARKNFNFVGINKNTLHLVDRIIIIRIHHLNNDEIHIEKIFDEEIQSAKNKMVTSADGSIRINKSETSFKLAHDKVSEEAIYKAYNIRQLSSGTIEVYKDKKIVMPTYPALRKIAQDLNVSDILINSNGSPYNTRQTGNFLIKTINEQIANVK